MPVKPNFLIGNSLNFIRIFFARGSVAKFLAPHWGGKVDSGIGLSLRTARLHRLAGGTTTLCWSQPNFPFRDYEFGYMREKGGGVRCSRVHTERQQRKDDTATIAKF